MSLCVWIVLAYSFAVVLSRNDLEEGYYWRHYNEEIPSDAFVASKNNPGENVYIAQTVLKAGSVLRSPSRPPSYVPRGWGANSRYPPYIRIGRSLPDTGKENSCSNDVIVTGHIKQGKKEMEYEWGNRRQVADNHVQILCTRNPDKLEWLETNTTEIVNLQDRHLIPGGTEKNYTIYIGRVILDDEVLVGKVLYTHLNYMDGFYSIANGSYVHLSSLFEVLAYNPSKDG